ncbi:uncharacterized protein LOC131317574 [Rhododendron vialii]|uniref:uncharacterized protein LOC131317574 n=1 Tax=Rhododendron vialii TaxID=182163 RepID=UPI00265F9E59|nr:uncharacterized protein LOC131317574 [Rhododendron vialii]
MPLALWVKFHLLSFSDLLSVRFNRYKCVLIKTNTDIFIFVFTPNGLASGEASKSSPLQFGSTTPGFMNGIQIPTAQTNTAPLNLDEQHDTVVKSQWHQATQLRRPRNSHILETVAPIVSFLVFLVFCYCCWRMCANDDTEEVADPEPEVELVVAEPVGVGPAVEVGLNPNVIDLFPVLLPFMIDGPVGFEGSECQICLEQFVHGENVRILPTCRLASKCGWPAEKNALFVAMST